MEPEAAMNKLFIDHNIMGIETWDKWLEFREVSEAKFHADPDYYHGLVSEVCFKLFDIIEEKMRENERLLKKIDRMEESDSWREAEQNER